MPLVKISDNGGATISAFDIDGYYFPQFLDKTPVEDQEKEIRSLNSWQARDDDVIVCTYPKSGTHWLWEVTCMLVKNKAERTSVPKERVMVEIMTQAKFNTVVSPRVFNSHIYSDYLPKDFVKRKCKILQMIRNPKDVAVSFFNHHTRILPYQFDGKWDDYVPRFLKGDTDYSSWFDYTLKWESFIKENPDYPILILHFEDMKENPLREVKRVAKFLGANCDEEFLQEVTKMCMFDQMKKEKDIQEDTNMWKDGKPGMYRKGEVGDWKNWFTVAQSDLFDSVYEEKMKDSDVRVRFTL